MPINDFHRTNINLFTSDVKWLQRKYGHGWTERVREIVHNWIFNEGRISEMEQFIDDNDSPYHRQFDD